MSEYFAETCPICYVQVINVYAQAHSEWHESLRPKNAFIPMTTTEQVEKRDAIVAKLDKKREDIRKRDKS